jgi:hypothetical protein
MNNKFKFHCISYPCQVLNKHVTLTLSYLEYSQKGNHSPSGMVDCDHATECGVKTNKGFYWNKCPIAKDRF